MVLVVLLYVKINAAVALIGITIGQYLAHELLLLNDMTRGVRLYGGRQDVKRPHGGMVAVSIVLRHLHRLQLLQPGFLLYLVIALVGIMFHMAYICDVPHIAHLVT